MDVDLKTLKKVARGLAKRQDVKFLDAIIVIEDDGRVGLKVLTYNPASAGMESFTFAFSDDVRSEVAEARKASDNDD